MRVHFLIESLKKEIPKAIHNLQIYGLHLVFFLDGQCIGLIYMDRLRMAGDSAIARKHGVSEVSGAPGSVSAHGFEVLKPKGLSKAPGV